MNLIPELKAAASPDLATLTDPQWRLVHAIYEWMRDGATFAECRQRLADAASDPLNIASRPLLKSHLVDLRTKLGDAAVRAALISLQATYLAKRAEFRAAQDARRAAIESSPR